MARSVSKGCRTTRKETAATTVSSDSELRTIESMNEDEFRKAGHAAIERIIEYNRALAAVPPSTSPSAFSVISKVDPGYLATQISTVIPENGVGFDEIQRDIEESIMPGITHWQSPNFMAYFPANASYPGILGDMYSDMLTCAAFNWQASPAVTELETIVMDMLGTAIGLDSGYRSEGEGGGVLFGTASEAALTMMIAARDRFLDSAEGTGVGIDQLVVIVSDQTHSGVEKAAQLLRLKCHKIKTTSEEEFAMTGTSLSTAIDGLRDQGMKPFFLCLTLGTTAVCAVDNFETISPILKRKENAGIWTHLDAAYAGSALVCPEYQHYLDHTDFYDSFELNAHKWLLTNFDCCCLWLRKRKYLIQAMDITPSYLRNQHSDAGLVTDYRNWGIPLGRRFRALKLWFVIRTYGLTGLQKHIRNHIGYSEVFVSLVKQDKTMEIIATPRFALCVLRFVDGDEITKQVYEKVNSDGRLFLTSSMVDGIYCIRVVGCSPHVREEHLLGAYTTLADTYASIKSGRV